MYRYLSTITIIYLTYLFLTSYELSKHISMHNNTTIIINDYEEDNIYTTILYYLILIIYLLSLL